MLLQILHVRLAKVALYLYLHFPALLADGLNGGQSVSLPVAIVNRQHQIVQLNSQALQQGLQLKMSLATAAALSPHLQVLPYRGEQQQRLLMSMAQRLYRLSSDIALDPPDGLFLHLSPLLTLYQGLQSYWQHINAELGALPYQYAFSCGNTALAAKVLAKQQLNLLSEDQQYLTRVLQQSELCFSDIDSRMQQQLQRLGIVTLGQVLALPQAELARRFDYQLLNYLGRLRGEFFHALDYIRPEPGFSTSLELLYDITDTAVLSSPLQRLLQQLEQYLTQQHAFCHQLILTLFCRDAQPQQLCISSAQGEYRAANWLQLSQLHLANLQLKQAVTGLSLQVQHMSQQQVLSGDLFSRQQSTLSPLQLISLLQARLGLNAVTGLMLQNQHTPEQANSMSMPFVSNATSVRPLKLRPAFLLSRPEPLRDNVEISSGPERLCTDAWALDKQRDYFIGRNKQGQWLWLYRNAQQCWYVQGLFS